MATKPGSRRWLCIPFSSFASEAREPSPQKGAWLIATRYTTKPNASRFSRQIRSGKRDERNVANVRSKTRCPTEETRGRNNENARRRAYGETIKLRKRATALKTVRTTTAGQPTKIPLSPRKTALGTLRQQRVCGHQMRTYVRSSTQSW